MSGTGATAKYLVLAGAMFVSAPLFAQETPKEVPRDESAFVTQAPEDQSSKVYFPEAITPESVAAARARAVERQRQIDAAKAQRVTPVAQVSSPSSSRSRSNDVQQLSDGASSAALSQLSAAERRVLLDAVEGTDICERGSEIPALQALCEGRIETRSEEFSKENSGSAEDSLLGGGLDATRVATLEAAIRRLASTDANPSSFDNQVVASVALNRQALSDSRATAAEGDPTADLSPETQGIVNAIVQQLGGGN